MMMSGQWVVTGASFYANTLSEGVDIVGRRRQVGG